MKFFKMPSHWRRVCVWKCCSWCVCQLHWTQLNSWIPYEFIIVIQSLCFGSINVTAWKNSQFTFGVRCFFSRCFHFCLGSAFFLFCPLNFGDWMNLNGWYFGIFFLTPKMCTQPFKHNWKQNLWHDTDFITGQTNVLMRLDLSLFFLKCENPKE